MPRRYTEDDRARAMAVLDSNGGNMRKTARDIGINEATLRSWFKPPQRTHVSKPGDVNQVRQQRPQIPPKDKVNAHKDQLGNVFDQIIDRFTGSLAALTEEELLDYARKRPKEAALVMAILFDKRQLLRGEATVITQQVRYMPKGSLKKFATELEVIEGGKRDEAAS